MPKIAMVSLAGNEFSCDEEAARYFESNGMARRKTSATSRAGASEYEQVMAHITGADADRYAHLAPAIVEMADARKSVRDTEAAAEIIAAGKKARGEGDPPPGPVGAAAQILNAGRKARGEVPFDPPKAKGFAADAAAQIIAAGRKARGETE